MVVDLKEYLNEDAYLGVKFIEGAFYGSYIYFCSHYYILSL